MLQWTSFNVESLEWRAHCGFKSFAALTALFNTATPVNSNIHTEITANTSNLLHVLLVQRQCIDSAGDTTDSSSIMC